jgi:hypothetical protein
MGNSFLWCILCSNLYSRDEFVLVIRTYYYYLLAINYLKLPSVLLQRRDAK